MKTRIVLTMVCMMLVMGLLACGTNTTTNNNGATLTSIAVTPVSPSIATGASQQFTATGTYSDNSTQNITASATWTSTDTNKANISNAGLATAVAAGTTTIKAMSGNISGTASLTITQQTATLVSIAVTPASPSIAIGASQQFVATGTYSDNTTQNITGSVTWNSSSTSKATISNAGLATGVAAGPATITAASGTITGTATLTVTTASPAYSNATLSGPWIWSDVYLIMDGNGTITDLGAFNLANPAGTYQVQSDGSFSMIWNFISGPSVTAAGSLYSSTTGTLTAQFGNGPITKVSNPPACQGNWSGTLTETHGGTASHPLTFTIDQNGSVTASTGYTITSGKMFCEAGNVAAHFKTTSGSPYNEIGLHGTLSGYSTI